MRYDPAVHHRRSIRLKGYDYAQAGAYFVTICALDRQCVFGEIADGEMRLNKVGEITRPELLKLPGRFSGIVLDQYVIMPNHLHVLILFAGMHTSPAGASTSIMGADPSSVGAQFIAPSMRTIGRPADVVHSDAHAMDRFPRRDTTLGDGPGTAAGAGNSPPAGRSAEGAMNCAPTVGREEMVGQGAAEGQGGTLGHGAMNRAPTLGEVVRAFKAATTRAIRVAGYAGFGWQRNYYEHVVRDEADLDRVREYIANNPARWAEDEENPEVQRRSSPSSKANGPYVPHPSGRSSHLSGCAPHPWGRTPGS
ncbi:MAG: hypothetical protein EPO21_16035 [Chloroflexota bacterium]|nr:MAG: hypothetical protein EPO21_16035 [Chloroflexota bacterium]